MDDQERPRRGRGATHWTVLSVLTLLVALTSAPAWARDATSRDATARDATVSTRVLSGSGLSSSAATPMSASSGSLVPAPWTGVSLLGAQFGAGAAAAVLTVPLTLWGASAVGSLSNNLLGAGLPSLIMLLVLPPLAVTLAEVVVGKVLGANPALLPTFWVTLGTQLVAIAGGVLLGLYAGNPADVALFTLGGAVLLPTATTLMLGLGQQEAAPAMAHRGGAAGTLPPMVSVPLMRGDF